MFVRVYLCMCVRVYFVCVCVCVCTCVCVFVCTCVCVCVCVQESRGFLQEALDVSSREGFSVGVKLVRGAYMDKERRQAEKEDRPDPVHDSWENTNHRYQHARTHTGNKYLDKQ